MDPNEHTSDPHSRQALERDLQAIRSARAGIGDSGPPDLVDQAVLNMARRELGWEPTVPLHDGLKSTVEWFEAIVPTLGEDD